MTVAVNIAIGLLVPGDAPVPVMATLRYEARDPYAVNASFRTGRGTDRTAVEWVFARQLLAEGMERPVGDGDVRVSPGSNGARVVNLTLSSPSGHAVFEVPRAAMEDFLARSYSVVPLGSESSFLDLDAELSLLSRNDWE
jgi:hypothetical protein